MSRYLIIYSLRVSWQVVDVESNEWPIIASGCSESNAQQIADHFNGVCARTLDNNAIRERDEARAQIVSGFFGDEVPTFRQGAPTHELEEVVTAEDCAHWVKWIKEHQ